MIFSATPSMIDVTALRQGQTCRLSWGRITRRSAMSLEVWETATHEHYLIGYNPQHPRLIDIVSLPEDPSAKEHTA